VTSDLAPIVVIAGVIERDGRFLVTRRLKDTHLSGYWEFPGGKCEPDETHDECLVRELREELGAAANVGVELLSVEHAYPTRTVRLHFRACRLLGDPTPLLGQEMRWITRDEMRGLEFPEADRALIDLLTSSRPAE
jgi:8-oxo-dGTP diphosphatase